MSAPLLTIPIRGRKFSLSVEVRETLARVETEFQTIEIVDTECFGKILLLDGHVQLASLDERAYHEALIHIPMLSIENPKRALVVGGGDGGVLRELVKHKCLESIEMVEIDRGVVETCRNHLPEISGGAFDDLRVRLHFADAFGYLREAAGMSRDLHPPTPSSGAVGGGAYDLIVLDITDVYEGEDGALSERLVTDAFYADCARALSLGGVLVTQADNHVFCPYSMEGIKAALRPHFEMLGSYQALVPSFGGYSAYVWASNGTEPPTEMPSTTGLDLAYLSKTTWALAFDALYFAQ